MASLAPSPAIGERPSAAPRKAQRRLLILPAVAFLLLFFVNLVLTAIYLQVVPPKGS